MLGWCCTLRTEQDKRSSTRLQHPANLMTTHRLPNEPTVPQNVKALYVELLDMRSLSDPGGAERVWRWTKVICGAFDLLPHELQRLPSEIVTAAGLDARLAPYFVPTVLPVLGSGGGWVHAFVFSREGDTFALAFPFDREAHAPQLVPTSVETYLRENPTGVQVQPWTGAPGQVPEPHHVLNNLSSLIVFLREVLQ